MVHLSLSSTSIIYAGSILLNLSLRRVVLLNVKGSKRAALVRRVVKPRGGAAPTNSDSRLAGTPPPKSAYRTRRALRQTCAMLACIAQVHHLPGPSERF